ncbi:MAG: hypothetical protein CMJ05_03610 [Pelagibacterales bacterium]|nr:hypothetical protein [Pelagibacterales bacterium]|tara:strand:+ start:329 stop:2236 length:1908 start_codon:yes stop_codon:yes gene_type:complete
MKYRIYCSNSKKVNKTIKSTPLIYQNNNFSIHGTHFIKQWKNDEGNNFFLIGDIIGQRVLGDKLSNIESYTLFEKKENTTLIEGRYIVIEVTNQNKVSIWADQFSRAEIFWAKNENGDIEVTSGIDMFSEDINMGPIDQNSLAQFITIYGNRPLKKHTLHENINRLGILETFTFSNDNIYINKIEFKPKTTFSKENTLKLNKYADFFIESVRARSSATQNIVFLSSGWDSTSILATLCHLFDASKIECIIGRMKYSNRSEIINQFELDRAQKMADYYNVKLHIVELNYTESIKEFIRDSKSIFRSQQFGGFTGLNHWLLAKGAKKIAHPNAVVFAGEISDGAHNLGFSQYFSIYHPSSHSFREYSDKMASYLFGPTFLSQLINGNHEDDPVWKILMSYYKDSKFDSPKQGKDDITAQLLSTFFLSGGRIPLYSKDNSKILTEKGRKSLLINAEETYLNEFKGKVDFNNLYSHYLHLYHSFHWQGGTVATLEHMCDAFGLKCRLPFIDQKIIGFLSEMPESWGRGLELNNTKFPLKWMLTNRIDYPIHLQEGPHSYLYDVNPSFSHMDEIVNASSLTLLFRELFQDEDFIKIYDPQYFDINYIKGVVSKLLSGKTLEGQELLDILSVGNLIAFGIV